MAGKSTKQIFQAQTGSGLPTGWAITKDLHRNMTFHISSQQQLPRRQIFSDAWKDHVAAGPYDSASASERALAAGAFRVFTLDFRDF